MAKIGIDFGTSYTTVSRVEPGTGVARPILINGKEKIPSVIYYSPDGDAPLFGDEAFAIFKKCLKIKDPNKVDEIFSGMFFGLKRDMNREEKRYLPDGSEKTYAELIGDFFRYIKKEAETTCFQGEPITEVCVTFPVAFEQYKKDILREACNLAGFKSVKLLMEPVAAAMGYENEQGETLGNDIRNKSILVYDFGGGTFDLAFIKFDSNGDYITLPPLGNPNCGGENIDLKVYEEWDKLVLKETRKRIAGADGIVDYAFVKDVCMTNKETLCNTFKTKSKCSLDEYVAGDFRSLDFTMDSWNSLIEPIVDQTIDLTKQMLEEINKEHFSIDQVILIGGSSRIPLVYEELSKILPIKPSRVAALDVAVANGAALFANQDMPIAKKCFCRMDGTELRTDMKFCNICGTPNIRYDYRFDTYEGNKSNREHENSD